MPTEVPTATEFAALASRATKHDEALASLAARVVALERGPQPPGPEPDPEPPAGSWLSGGNPNNNSQTGAELFGAWRKRKCGLALTYPPRDKGWGPLVSATALPQGVWTDKSVKLVVQTPIFPAGPYTYAEAAAGKYRDYHKQLGTNWRKREEAGFARPVFMLNWEANHKGPGMHYWGGPGTGPQQFRDYEQFVKAFQVTAEAVWETYEDAEFGLTGNGHDSPGFYAARYPANDPRNYFPGREYVRYIGVDYYDHFPPSFGGTSTSSKRKDFDVESREVNGVRWYMEWAYAEGVQFAVPEWACNSGNVAGGDHGGDNPQFVRNMFTVFREAWVRRLPDGRPLFAGECYYEDTAQKMGIYNGQNPKAAAEYLRLFGG